MSAQTKITVQQLTYSTAETDLGATVQQYVSNGWEVLGVQEDGSTYLAHPSVANTLAHLEAVTAEEATGE